MCKKWDTLTGGWSGKPKKIGNFCGSDCWLVWIYFMDIQCDYLLFGNAKGTPPVNIGNESGFEVGSPGRADDHTEASKITPLSL